MVQGQPSGGTGDFSNHYQLVRSPRSVATKPAIEVGELPADLVQRRRWESNPLEAALQAAAVPSGSDVVHQASSPGIEPGPRPSQSRMRVRHTPRTCFLRVPCRGIEPGHRPQVGPAVSKTAVLSGTLAGHQPQFPDLESEPGPRPSESRTQSATPSGHRSYQGRRLDSHQHDSPQRTNTARRTPFSVEPRRHSSAVSTSVRI